MAALVLSAPSKLHSRLQHLRDASLHDQHRQHHDHRHRRAPSRQRLHETSHEGDCDHINHDRSLRYTSPAGVSGPERRQQRALHAPSRSEAVLDGASAARRRHSDTGVGGRCAKKDRDNCVDDDDRDGQSSDPVTHLRARPTIDERGMRFQTVGCAVLVNPTAPSDMTLEGFLAAEGKTLSDYSCPICLELYSEPDGVMPVTLECCSNSLCLACCNTIIESRILTSLRRKAGHLVNDALLGQSAVVLRLVRLREEKEAEAQRRADEEECPKARRKEAPEHVRFAELAAHTPAPAVEAGPPGLNSSGSRQSRPKRKAEAHPPRSLPPRARTRSAAVSSPTFVAVDPAVSSRFQKPGREAPSTTRRKRTRAHSGAGVRISLHNLDGAGTDSDEVGDDDDGDVDNGGGVSYRDGARDSCRRLVRKRARLHNSNLALEGESPGPSAPRTTGGIYVLLDFGAAPEKHRATPGAMTPVGSPASHAETRAKSPLGPRSRRARSSRSSHRTEFAVEPPPDKTDAAPGPLRRRSRSRAPKVLAPAAGRLEAPRTPLLGPPLPTRRRRTAAATSPNADADDSTEPWRGRRGRPRSLSNPRRRLATAMAAATSGERRGRTTIQREAAAARSDLATPVRRGSRHARSAAAPAVATDAAPAPRSPPFLLLVPRELQSPGADGGGRLVDIGEGRRLRSCALTAAAVSRVPSPRL
ncbi:hypothetical protein HK405_003800 [Cladochytrium tenue]|nr:hypothetical protein HK405_003800 [Cladochytrium tenue]